MKKRFNESIEVTEKRYSREQIDVALDTLINDRSEILIDTLGNHTFNKY